MQTQQRGLCLCMKQSSRRQLQGIVIAGTVCSKFGFRMLLHNALTVYNVHTPHNETQTDSKASVGP